MPQYKVITETIDKPDLDDRHYRVVELSNSLRALLIHDPTTDKAAASLDVNVGAFHDPHNLPGLAHFCEHLLFMGTEKYPLENEYSSFLSKNSGYSNAYTSSQDTNYYFEVGYEHLDGALDRFAQFFISPLFDKSCKDREIKAVDSENKKNLQNDNWRFHQLEKSLTSTKHPYNGFSTGNYQTLGEIPEKNGLDVREELISWYNSHYSANLMRLVVLGREDLDTLTEWTVKRFSDVKNTDKPRPYFPDPPITSEQLLKLVKAKPVMETRSLELTFTVPDVSNKWEYGPARYASHLIGHEGKGSLLYHFKTKGWANGLSAGAMRISKGYSVFVIEIELTPEGFKNYETAIFDCFDYIKLLTTEPPQEWIFEEMKQTSSFRFKFQQKGGAANTVSKLSAAMQKDVDVPYKNLLSSGITRKWDADLIKDYLSHFNASNFKVSLISKEFGSEELPLREKWYGTEYNIEPISPEILSKIAAIGKPSGRFQLLTPNEFIPTKFDIVGTKSTSPAKEPYLIQSDTFSKTWFKQDDQFLVPKSHIFVKFNLPVATLTPFNSAMSSLFLDLLEDELNEMSYEADIVGLSKSFNVARDGISLEISGYNDKMEVLLHKLIDAFVSFKPTEERFNILKERSKRLMKNFGFSTPYSQIGQHTSSLINERAWSVDEQLSFYESDLFTYQRLTNFVSTLFDQCFNEILIVGNYSLPKAKELAALINSKIKAISAPLAQSQYTRGRSLKLPVGQTFRFEKILDDPANINSCIEYFIQLGEIASERRAKVLVDLLAQVAHEPCFNRLRTKEQLGYVVFSGVREARTTFGFRILIQSERPSPYVESRIDAFLQSLVDYIERMDEAEYVKHVNGLVSKKTQKLKNLKEEFSRFWNSIATGFYDFDKRAADVEILKTITKAELLEFYKTKVLQNNGKLVVHLNAQTTSALSWTKIAQSSIMNYIALKEDDLPKDFTLGPELDKLITLVEDKSIDDLLSLHEFSELFPKSVSPQFFSGLTEYIKSNIANPIPKSYPKGELITDLGDFKSKIPLTSAAYPLRNLSDFELKPEIEAKL
ncbi:unnamed protein product [Kuraishia capsulata CBS 1993]|uniref:A-factor-processing enzyme n=1 Tax=Kuraishia capsulata CBS 1993 TaxID=1382522 RepID=W6MNB7_9ASCO|nr:uncharacterized protein KUCA_T00004087001 [Kuraishia capsulata CBS 1993]CDK28106.1 unnamed protein product [Kuraishia capsulata CBS 1993]